MAVMSQIIEGMAILKEYADNTAQAQRVYAKQDQIWTGPVQPGEITPGDLYRLRNLGWSWDNSLDLWTIIL